MKNRDTEALKMRKKKNGNGQVSREKKKQREICE